MNETIFHVMSPINLNVNVGDVDVILRKIEKCKEEAEGFKVIVLEEEEEERRKRREEEEKKEKVIKGLGDGKEGKRKRVKEGKEREV